jgi:phytoene desaturase
MTRACVIGAGLGGLALAIRLQSSGAETVLIEARDRPGGRCAGRERERFRFGGGPRAIAEPAAFAELWGLSGRDIAEDVTWLPVEPLRRCNWPDGTMFDITGGSDAAQAALRREIARIAPGDAGGYEELLAWAEAAQRDGANPWLAVPERDPAALATAVPTLLRRQAWRSAWGKVAGFVGNERLREALTVGALAGGVDPLSASAFHALAHRQEVSGGLWWPKGGMGALAEAMAGLLRKLGGQIVLRDPVLHIHTLGNRASEVECVSGWRQRFDMVASSADAVHTYRDLLSGSTRGPEAARTLRRLTYTPGEFTVHFGLEGAWPGIPHETVLFGPRYRGLIEDVFVHGVLPRDMLIFLHHPSVTDPSLAPRGKSLFSATIPVANQSRLPIDWEQTGPLIEQRILAEVGRRLIPDIEDRIVVKYHVSPRDRALDFSAWAGSAHGLAPTAGQALWPAVPVRDARLRNLFFAGGDSLPGGGVAGALASARAAARRMLEAPR